MPSLRLSGLTARDPAEQHRAATPLELLTDLCFVVAVAQAATQLHHFTTEGDLASGLIRYGMVFFAIWWTWLNFAWFASAYDDDGIAYRLLTLLQIVGSLVIAAGVPRMFEGDFTLVVVGYLIMRVGLVVQWLRAAAGDPDHRRTCLRYAVGIPVVQLLWLVFLTGDVGLVYFLVCVACELVVPVWAERPNQTRWHAHHIAERYGLFFIIVLGETILSVTLAIQESVDEHDLQRGLAYVVLGGVLIVFSLWWLYFAHGSGDALERARGTGTEYVWGFGHYAVFASAAAIGAALAARVDYWERELVHGHAVESGPSATLLCLSVAALLAASWVVKVRPDDPSAATAGRWGAAVGAVVVLVLVPAPEIWVGLVCVVLLFTELRGQARGADRGARSPA
ncbi:low temperature requirement protein A [Mumia zhuanghuii]|uniref:Low temperature requirement protein A n=2 Tax=Mumia TaxID=1546255 RepID=A0ABW1QM05_9ACTN|nr:MULTISPECIES: low temperature requirement protein A [Mumia]KAA1425150.1 low temperature requirement protein A [Mumia zhuanghuii]